MLDAIFNVGVAVLLIILIAKVSNIQDLLKNDIDDLKWGVEKRNAHLMMAVGWFKDYAVQHRNKNTVESNAKAAVNENRAETLRRMAQETI